MKRKYHIFIICLLSMILVNQPSIADSITATFIFGKIEILKAGEREWAFLEKGAALTDSDLVRMPPVSLIRLKDAQGTFLPTLSGGRELTVSVLIREGIQRRNATKGRRINEPLEGSPAIDVLPLGDKPKGEVRSHAPDRSQSVKLTPTELAELRRHLDSLPAEMVSWISQLPSRDTSATDQYPGSNLYQAQMLYMALNDIEAKSLNTLNHLLGVRDRFGRHLTLPDSPVLSLLYAQLLRHVKIDADLVTNEQGELCVIFDSGVSLDKVKWITANHQLIYKKQDADTLWISIHLQSEKYNFTTAWYNGTMER